MFRLLVIILMRPLKTSCVFLSGFHEIFFTGINTHTTYIVTFVCIDTLYLLHWFKSNSPLTDLQVHADVMFIFSFAFCQRRNFLEPFGMFAFAPALQEINSDQG